MSAFTRDTRNAKYNTRAAHDLCVVANGVSGRLWMAAKLAADQFAGFTASEREKNHVAAVLMGHKVRECLGRIAPVVEIQ